MKPELRFKGFEGEWEKKKIINIAPLQRGFDLVKKDIIPGKYPVGYSNGILRNHNEFKVEGPGVFTGRSGTIGNVHYTEKKYWPHNTSLWVTDFKGNYAKFIYFFYISVNLKRYDAGSGVPTLNRNDVHSLNKFIPKYAEQQKIADFLTLLDRRIEQQQEKIESWRSYKMGMMQNLFSREFRFKDEDGLSFPKWEERFIVEIADVSTGNKDTHDKVDGGKYPFFVRSNHIENIDSYSFDGEAILTAGDGVGVGKVFHYINGKFDFHQRVYKISGFKGCIGRYLYYYFSKNFLREAMKYNAKTSVDSVRREMITKMLVPLPSLQEQKKIAKTLSLIEMKIEKEEMKFDSLMEQKEGFMQQMFI